MKHLMIDLETLGTKVNAPIVAVGACFFDPETGAIGKTFDAAIDVEDALNYGKIEGGTFKWWMQQGEDARMKVVRGRHLALKVMEAFVTFAGTHGDQVQPWGNGASFDISMLDYAIPRITGKPVPWKFWNVRDCRTIKALADGVVNYSGERKGVHHTALDDAIHQAEWVSVYWQGLRGLTVAAPASSDVDDLLG